MALTSKDRAELRAEAHHLTPMVHVGHHGITPAVLESLEDALRTFELVKVQLTRTVDVKAKDAANALALATSSAVVQVIGRTATLYRENPELKKKSGDLPPWRR
ncbi:MAG TPA: YhbY family RNA-binding protein [Gemmatimonadaceae bacterium]|nr:YhbY family RNA-binding protein [Gemmatimonadaceae bacterium]